MKNSYTQKEVNRYDNKINIEEIFDDLLSQFNLERPKIPEISILNNKDEKEEKINLEDFQVELNQIKKSVSYLSGQIKEINNKLKELTDMKITEELNALGFHPVTKEVLVGYPPTEIERCESIILDEIRKTGGDTDPDVISRKHSLPLNLVAGCFDKLLEDGVIGEE